MGREAFLPARGVGVQPSIILPPPPDRYNVEDQKAVREILQKFGQQQPDWTTVTSMPAPVTALAALTGAADNVPYFTGISTMALTSLTPYARTLLATAAAAAARAVLGIAEHRSSQAKTTASLANLAVENGTIAMPDTVARLLTIKADRVCWVRLYTDAAARTNDSTRAFGISAAAGKGVLAEFVYDNTMTFPFTIPCSPVPILANNDGTPASLIYYTIQNRSGATSTVTVTLGYGALP